MKKYYKYIIIIFIVILTVTIIVAIRSYLLENYKVLENTKTKNSRIIPTNEYYKYSDIGYQALRSELLWISANQYIAENIFSQDYKQYLAMYIDRITTMHPEFVNPYITAQLLLPGYNERYGEISKEEQEKNINNAITLSKKGIAHFCNQDLLEKISVELLKKDIYLEPCKESQIPYYLGFIYYQYKKDTQSSSYWYAVAASNKDTQVGAKKLAILMQSKAGNNKLAFELYNSLLKNSTKKEENLLCSEIIQILDKRDFSTTPPKHKELELLQELDNRVYPLLESGDINGNCEYYTGRILRELNLWYLNLYHSKKQAPLLLKDYIALEKQGIYYILNDDSKLYEPKMMLHTDAMKRFAH